PDRLPPPEEHDDPSRIPWSPPWLREEVQRRWADLFERRPGTARITNVAVTNDRPEFKGICPVTITFDAAVSVAGGPGIVWYTWLRSDGALGPMEQLTVPPGNGTYTVSTTWTLGGPGMTYSGWQALRVVYPDFIESSPSRFTFTCTGERLRLLTWLWRMLARLLRRH